MTEAVKKNKPIKNQFIIGRNNMCPCNSGKKWKKCCLEKINFRQQMIKFVYCNQNKMPSLAQEELKITINMLVNNNKLSLLWDWLEENTGILNKDNVNTIIGMTKSCDDESRQKFVKMMTR